MHAHACKLMYQQHTRLSLSNGEHKRPVFIHGRIELGSIRQAPLVEGRGSEGRIQGTDKNISAYRGAYRVVDCDTISGFGLAAE